MGLVIAGCGDEEEVIQTESGDEGEKGTGDEGEEGAGDEGEEGAGDEGKKGQEMRGMKGQEMKRKPEGPQVVMLVSWMLTM